MICPTRLVTPKDAFDARGVRYSYAAGYAVGAPLINLFYDIFGSYYLVLIITGIIFSLIFVLLLTVISAAYRDKRKLSESTTHIVQ